jgi:simple sugar transport system substrate-binding protein
MKRILLLCITLCLLLPVIALAKGDKVEKEDEVEIVVIVKLEHPWFDDMEKGIADAAKDLGINAYMLGPAEADPAQQVALVEDSIAKGVDAICVVPNDPAALEPVFEKANKAGIYTLTHESITSQNISYDIEAFDNATFGRHIMDNLVNYMGDEGGYVCFVGNLTAVTHNQWVDAEIAQQKEKYPNMYELTDRVVSDENTQVAYQKTLDLIKTYGDELKGIITSSAASAPGVGIAIEEKGLIDKLICVGTGVPSLSADVIEAGSVKVISLWRPADAGYVQVWIANELINGRTISDGQEIPRYGKIRLKGKIIYGSEEGILDVTRDNLDQFDF